MHQIQFRLGFRPRPAGELTDLLAGFKGLLLREGGEGVEIGRGEWRVGNGMGLGKGGEGKGEDPGRDTPGSCIHGP